MALNAAIVWEVRTTGSDNNGGGFKAGATGTDRSQQDAAQATLTTSSTVHTTTTQINVAAGDYTVVAADVGNVLQVTGGTATAGFYEITAVDTVNNRWTVDRAVGTSTQTVAGKMGGALGSPGNAAGVYVAGNTIHVKSGTYSVTSTTANASGGRLNFATAGSATAVVRMIGYGSARLDGGTKPVIQASGISGVSLVTLSATFVEIENLSFDGALLSSISGYSSATSAVRTIRCKFANCTAGGILPPNANQDHLFCEVTGCTTISPAAAFYRAIGCSVHDNSVVGVNLVDGGTFERGLVCNNTGAGSDGIAFLGRGLVSDTTVYGSGRDGIRHGTSHSIAVNSISYGNAGWQIGAGASANMPLSINCAVGTGGSGGVNTSLLTRATEGLVTLTGDPFTNAASGDFSLNSTAGRGAACRAAGIPGAFPGGTTTGYPDIGAAQHADSGGGISLGKFMLAAAGGSPA